MSLPHNYQAYSGSRKKSRSRWILRPKKERIRNLESQDKLLALDDAVFELQKEGGSRRLAHAGGNAGVVRNPQRARIGALGDGGYARAIFGVTTEIRPGGDGAAREGPRGVVVRGWRRSC